MHVLVTGGAGYIGSHMVHVLNDMNIKVTVIDNLSTGNIKHLPSNIELIKCNVGDEEKVYNIIKEKKISTVVHFAASVVVPESVKNPIKYYNNNTSETIKLIKSCVQAKIENFIFSSTAAVYGNPKNHIVVENSDKFPESPYGMSKLISEKIIEDTFSTYAISYIVLRYFNVAGADTHGRTGQTNLPASHLIRVACQTACNKRDFLPVYGNNYNTPDGTCIRDFIHVIDLIEAHIKAIIYLKDGGDSGIFNCGYGQGYSVMEVINEVKKVSGKDFKIKIENRRLGDPEKLIADNKKIKKQLNWKPKFNDLNKIIDHAFKWESKLIDL